MIERALTAGVPVSWVLGDEVYGNDRRLRIWLEQHERPHVQRATRRRDDREGGARGARLDLDRRGGPPVLAGDRFDPGSVVPPCAQLLASQQAIGIAIDAAEKRLIGIRMPCLQLRQIQGAIAIGVERRCLR